MPLAFVANYGQAPDDVCFTVSGGSRELWLKADGSIDVVSSGGVMPLWRIVGAQPSALIDTLEPLGARLNVYSGSDRSRWKTGLRMFAGVRLGALLPGIDVDYRALGDRLRFEFRISPGADTRMIQLRFPPASETRAGIAIETGNDVLGHYQVAAWQTVDRESKNVSASLRVSGEVATINVGEYNRAEPLVVNVTVNSATYLGGSGWDAAYAIASDSAGNLYLTGETASFNFPVGIGQVDSTKQNLDAFVTKISGSTLIYTTILSGGGDDRGRAISVDSGGAAFVAGSSSGPGFPTTAGAVQTAYQGGMDAFVTKLDSSGHLVYGTYLGAGGDDVANGIGVDSAGSVYIAGYTSSPGFPVTTAALQRNYGGGLNDAFIAKLSADGSALIYSTFFGGAGSDVANCLAIDSAGRAYIGGSTTSSILPIVNAYQSAYGGSGDGFVAEVNPSGTGLVFSTYLGGAGPDLVNAIALDASANIYVAGAASGVGLAYPAYQIGPGGAYDAFVVKLNPAGLPLHSTVLGGSGTNSATGLRVDGNGRAWIVGITNSTDFPILAAAHLPSGASSGFFARISADGSALASAGLIGGSGYNYTAGITLLQNRAAITGYTSSTDLPATSGAIQTSAAAGYNGFVEVVSFESANVGIFRNGLWVFDLSGTGSWNPGTVQQGWLGLAGDNPVVGDWNGTGKTKAGIFRNGLWSLDVSGAINWNPATVIQGVLGMTGDKPVIGDWNGSGTTKVGIFRNGIWILDLSGAANFNVATSIQGEFGQVGDIPVVGDWNGTGTTKVGVFRNGTWILDLSGTAVWSPTTVISGAFGLPGDTPIVGDWDGSGKTKVGVFRNGCWILDLSGTANWNPSSVISGCFGLPGDTPLEGFWNNDGTARVGIFRSGQWQLDLSGTANWNPATTRAGWLGLPGDIPVIGYW